MKRRICILFSVGICLPEILAELEKSRGEWTITCVDECGHPELHAIFHESDDNLCVYTSVPTHAHYLDGLVKPNTESFFRIAIIPHKGDSPVKNYHAWLNLTDENPEKIAEKIIEAAKLHFMPKLSAHAV